MPGDDPARDEPEELTERELEQIPGGFSRGRPNVPLPAEVAPPEEGDD